MDTVHETHERHAYSVLEEISVVGGYSAIGLELGAFVYMYFGMPFRNLKLGIKFNELVGLVKHNLNS